MHRVLTFRAYFRFVRDMSSRQFPSKMYPRLESVDLEDSHPGAARKTTEIINFEDHEGAFRSKSSWEVMRALIVLRLCGFDTLVDHSLQMMRWTQRICGHSIARCMVKPVFYKQFVGGETSEEIRACVRRLAESGLRAMLATTLEEDVGEGGDEAVYDKNAERIIQSLEIAVAEDTPSPMIQLKLSGLLSADLLVVLGNLYATSRDKVALIDAVSQGISGDSVLMIPPLSEVLDDGKREALHKAVQRLKRIGSVAESKGVKVLVDAEYTYLNPGLSLLTLAAAKVFNPSSPLIWNTYQCYLKDAMNHIQAELKLVTENLGCHFGAKVVRGAYMTQERSRAQKLQIPDPVCESYEATSNNYNAVVAYLFERCSELTTRCHFIVASHNEKSVTLAIERMKDLGMERHRGSVCFGQLYGMCDQVSNPLANAGFSVYKSIPYGSVEEVMPYLARRASENKSVLQGARKEQTLLSKELRRRFRSKISCHSDS